MARIPYTDKTTAQVSPLPAEQKWTSGDANVVKDSVNAIYDADAATGGEVMFNDGTDVGKSGDLTFDGVLQVGANSNAGQIQLGGPDDTAVGTVSSNGTLTMEGEDVVVSGGESVELTTNAVSRLKVDVDGAWLVEGAAGTATQYLKSNGPATPPEWATAQASEVSVNTFFWATVNGVRGLYKYLLESGSDTDTWQLEGTSFTDYFFGSSGAWQYQGLTTAASSSEVVANPTLVTSWTGSATISTEETFYGPTVQDVLEQVAAKPAPFMDYTTPPAAYDGLALLGGAITGGAGGVTLNLTTLIPGITAAKFVNGFSIEGVPFFAMPGGGGLTDFVALFLDTAGDPAGDGNECSVIIAYKL